MKRLTCCPSHLGFTALSCCTMTSLVRLGSDMLVTAPAIHEPTTGTKKSQLLCREICKGERESESESVTCTCKRQAKFEPFYFYVGNVLYASTVQNLVYLIN